MRQAARFKFSIYSSVIDFPRQDFGSVEIADFLHDLTKDLVDDELPEWTVNFHGIFCKDNYAANCKRVITYRSDPKEKRYSIRIPVPSDKDIDWGVAKKQYTYEQPFVEKNWKNLSIVFRAFDNEKDYVIACAKTGITRFFQDGITVQGRRIKL